MTTPKPDRLSLSTLAAYGALGLPLSALLLPFAVFIPPYYASLPMLSAGVVGLMLSIARISDVFVDVAVGAASDRTRTRIGRRRPWLIAGVPVLLFGAWHVFLPPKDADGLYLLIWCTVTYIGWSLVTLPYNTWGAELSPDYDERTRITSAREIGLVFGTLVAIVLPTAITQAGGTTADGLRAMFWFLLVALPVSAAVLLWRVPEAQFTQSAGMSLRAGLKLLTQNRAFGRLLAAFLLNTLANTLPATLFVFFTSKVVGMTEKETGIALVLYFVLAIAALPAWLHFGRNLSKHRLWAASMIWAAVAFACMPFLGPGDYWLYMALTVACGLCLGIDQAMPASMQADVVDEDTALGVDNGGGQRAGLYFGLWAMATKFALALAVGVSYPLLDAVGFDADSDANSRSALLVLALLYGALPVVIKLGAVALVWNYPLDRRRHAELQARIAAQAT